MFSWYGDFIILPNEIKQRNKIKLEPVCPRFDCIRSVGYYKGIEPFINKKGMIKFNLMRTDEHKTDEKRKADYYLQGEKSMNFSSLFPLALPEIENICFGEPNDKPTIKSGKAKIENPMLPYKNDGYLFIIEPDYTRIELLVIENGRFLIKAYAKQLASGEFDEMLKQFRDSAKTYYKY